MLLESIGPTYAANVVAGLNGTGTVGTVTDFDGAANVPSESDFAGIDVVLVVSDDEFGDPDGIGDALADYVDGGGRVVQTTFSLECSSDVGVGGRWVSGGYGAFDITPCDQIDGDGPLGFTAVDATSPLLAGVTSFNGGSDSYRNEVNVASGTTLVARWDDEASTPFEAWTTAHAGCVVGLNFYPPSSDVRDGFWDASTDGWILQANALNFTCAASPPPVTPPSTPTFTVAPVPVTVVPAFTG